MLWLSGDRSASVIFPNPFARICTCARTTTRPRLVAVSRVPGVGSPWEAEVVHGGSPHDPLLIGVTPVSNGRKRDG